MEFNGGTPIESLYRIDCPVFPASPESVEQVIKAAQDVTAQTGSPVRLIVLDTLARCFGGSDENAAIIKPIRFPNLFFYRFQSILL